jgi:hypothetical protein
VPWIETTVPPSAVPLLGSMLEIDGRTIHPASSADLAAEKIEAMNNMEIPIIKNLL